MLPSHLRTGTSQGIVDIYGEQSRGVEHRVELSEPLRIRSLSFVSSLLRLVAVGSLLFSRRLWKLKEDGIRRSRPYDHLGFERPWKAEIAEYSQLSSPDQVRAKCFAFVL